MKKLTGLLNKYIKKIKNEFLYLLNIFFKKRFQNIMNRFLKMKILNIFFNFFKKKLKWIVIILIILINLILFYVSNTNFYYTILFYPDKNKINLIAEKRAIIKEKNKKQKIKNTIEQLLLGPIEPGINNIFPKEAKLLSIKLIGKNVLLNFNRETIMNIKWEKNQNVSIYYIFLQSIVNSICFQHKDVDRVKFYFNGKEFEYIGNYGPMDIGLKPDWSILSR